MKLENVFKNFWTCINNLTKIQKKPTDEKQYRKELPHLSLGLFEPTKFQIIGLSLEIGLKNFVNTKYTFQHKIMIATLPAADV